VELELELMQTQTTQKPLLRAEWGPRVCNANGTCENQGAWVAKLLIWRGNEVIAGAEPATGADSGAITGAATEAAAGSAAEG
jgi:hypothetical protein